jgi:hypothetical protein
MSWRTRSTVDDQADEIDAPASLVAEDEIDDHGFWDNDRLDTVDDDDAFAVVLDVDGEDGAEDETLLYMGNVAPVDAGELTDLADWAESKACKSCTRRFSEHADDHSLRHDDCRKALHTGRLLRRYS